MKAKKIRLGVLVACVAVLSTMSCAKETTSVEPCRTCTARLDGSLIEQIEACSSEAESNFASRHPYATVMCR